MPYFLRRGRRIELEQLDRVLVLRGGGDTSERLAAYLPKGVRELAYDEETDTLVLEGDAEAIHGALRAARLENRVRTDAAYHRAGGPPGDFWAPTGRVSVRLPEAWTSAKVDSILAAYKLRRVEKIDEMSNGFFVMAQGDSIEAARDLVEQDGALFAEPDFIRRMPRRTRAPGAAKAASGDQHAGLGRPAAARRRGR